MLPVGTTQLLGQSEVLKHCLVFAALTWSGALDSLEDLTVDYRLRLAGIVNSSPLLQAIFTVAFNEAEE